MGLRPRFDLRHVAPRARKRTGRPTPGANGSVSKVVHGIKREPVPMADGPGYSGQGLRAKHRHGRSLGVTRTGPEFILPATPFKDE